ncbi:hypothetical protein PVAP13_6KG170700 [Panicum virgatum]|uniref:Uncharacterized protein n=1 Tax=Panicum virgatum TaxID=38727 RepID=A0A8T0RAC2_PANVG|nr:hypothetical protein PVAP13_6KG170700 [Panicum virgatum]
MSTPCWVVQSKTSRFPAGRAWRSSFTTVTSVPFSLRLQLAAPTTTGSRQVAGGFVPGSGGNGASKGCSHRGPCPDRIKIFCVGRSLVVASDPGPSTPLSIRSLVSI